MSDEVEKETQETPPAETLPQEKVTGEVKPNISAIREELQRLGSNALSQLHSENEQLKAKLAALEEKLSSTSIKEETPKSTFFEDPDSHLSIVEKRLKEEMKNAVEPLVSFVDKLSKKEKLEDSIRMLKSQPNLAKVLTPDVEAIVSDIVMRSNVDITPEVVQASLVQAIGIKALQGDFKVSDDSPKSNVSAPASIPPTPPKGIPDTRSKSPLDTVKDKAKNLTEDERAIARRFFSTSKNPYEEYVIYRDYAGDDVEKWSSEVDHMLKELNK